MPLVLSTTLITLIRIFYLVGVWSERISRYLKGRHVATFWTGFFFDVAGTLAMSRFSYSGGIKGRFIKARPMLLLMWLTLLSPGASYKTANLFPYFTTEGNPIQR